MKFSIVIAVKAVLYALLLTLAMLTINKVTAADQSPLAYNQAITCTVYSSMAHMHDDIVRVHRNRAPKRFTHSHAYLVGLAEGKVLGFTANQSSQSLVEHKHIVIESAASYYIAEQCTINEYTSLLEGDL